MHNQNSELFHKKHNEKNEAPYYNIIIIKPLTMLDIKGVLCYRVKTIYAKTTDDKGNTMQHKNTFGHAAHTDITPRSDISKFLNF